MNAAAPVIQDPQLAVRRLLRGQLFWRRCFQDPATTRTPCWIRHVEHVRLALSADQARQVESLRRGRGEPLVIHELHCERDTNGAILKWMERVEVEVREIAFDPDGSATMSGVMRMESRYRRLDTLQVNGRRDRGCSRPGTCPLHDGELP
ncbi:MAG: hypothetical protein IPK87_00105 [Planctomycetes bacterium]|nr:hypothetical protein [Planctomycetota bacterium]